MTNTVQNLVDAVQSLSRNTSPVPEDYTNSNSYETTFENLFENIHDEINDETMLDAEGQKF